MSDDFDFEPVRGLPEMLPAGERLLWQGAPRWQDLAVHAFHARKVIWYFLAIAIVQAVFRLADGSSLAEAAWPFVWLLPMGGIAAAILTFLAYVSARTTVYSMTTKRLVMRIGIALPVTLNLPFRLVDSASLRLYANGSGEIPLKLAASERVAYLLLWPHARPMHFRNPQPCLRAIPDADQVAKLLATALSNAPQSASARQGQPVKLPVRAVAA
jgi:Bacterial PH domain